MTPADKLYAQGARKRFAEIVSLPDQQIDLAHAALLIASEERRVEVPRYLAMLDKLGELARVRIKESKGAVIDAFNGFMFEELGFAGNQLDYYDPRNSFLNYVLERRRGIPITLSVVYIEVGRRAGLEVEGVGMPGHFIVSARAQGQFEGTLVDPFHGVTLDHEDCQERLDTVFDGQVTLKDEHLRPATKREILVRILTNLKAIYARSKLYRQSLAATERILLLTPKSPREHRDRGALLEQLDQFTEAIFEMQFYLKLLPDAPDKEDVRERLNQLQKRWAMLN